MAESNVICKRNKSSNASDEENPLIELLRRISLKLDEENLESLCKNYLLEKKHYPTAFHVFQYLEEQNLWFCATVQEKIEVLIKQMKMLGRMDIVKIIKTFKEKEFPKLSGPVQIVNIQNSVISNSLIFSKQATDFKDVCTYTEETVHVLECDEKFYTDHSVSLWDEVYPIQHRLPKAHVLILNNYEGFKGGPQKDRHGSKRDGELMKQLWEGFQCKVIVKENQTAKKMKTSLTKFLKEDFHKSCDFCVVIIMSHGKLKNGHSKVGGTDGKSIKIIEVVKLFRDCPHLNGKPKLIFCQSCRGDEVSAAVPISCSGTAGTSELRTDKSSSNEAITVPKGSDILVAYSTTEGNVAFRHPATGSWFINAIAKVFSKKAKTEHVVDMLTEVGNKVSQMEDDGDRQMSEFVSSLRKKLYLFPGFPKQ
ncbi:caspase-2-like [Ciona intestinalis]